MIFLFLSLISAQSAIYPNIGWGGTIFLNWYSDTVCTVNNVKQTSLNKCTITCSSITTVLIKLTSTNGTDSQLYFCYTKPTVTSVDLTTIYVSLPYNLTITGTNFFNTTSSLCALGSTYFTATYISTTQYRCQYTSIKAGTYTLSLQPNGYDSIGSLSVKVLNSYRFSSISPLANYVSTSVQVLGSRLDGDLYCNFSTSSVKVTFVSSSNVTCLIPSGLVGSFSVWMQNSALLALSGKYTVTVYDKISLKLTGPYPVTGNLLNIEYSGTIVEAIFCVISSTTYNAVYGTKYISCDISALAEGDYNVYVKNQNTQISSNSLTLTRRINNFNASFEESTDLIVTITSSLSIPRLYCKWGYNKSMLMQATGLTFICPTSSVMDKGKWCVELSYDGENFTNSCLYEYEKKRKANFIEVIPNEIVVHGEVVKVYYDKIYNSTYVCRINETDYVAIVNDSYVECGLPALSAGFYLLEMYQDGVLLKGFDIKYVESIEILSTFPKFFTEKTNKLDIFGNYFYKTSPCYLNTIILTCSYINSSYISCTIPLQTSDSILYCENIDKTSSNNYIILHHKIPIISKFLPETIFEGIYNLIYVQGSGFYNESYVRFTCLQQHTEEVEFINEELILTKSFENFCYVFGTVTIALSPNNLDFTSEYNFFIYPLPNLNHLSFYSSPYLGGDILQFYGNGFVDSLYCNFGGILVEANINNYEEGNCTVPYHDIGSVDFSLYMSGLEYTNIIITYTFSSLIEFSISPNTGVSSGGTVVTLIGSFNTLGSDAYCIFGYTEVPAQVSINATCTSPEGVGTVLITYKASNKLYASYKPVYYIYVNLPSITGLSIPSSPSLGNSSVIITGSGFTNIYRWQCRFGDYYTESIYLSSTKILCYSPPQPPVSIQIYMTNNIQELTNSLSFTYTSDISVYSFSPIVGPATGLTSVTMSGKSLSVALYCKIGLTIFSGTTSSSGIKCLTPVWWYGPTSIEISSNALDFTRSNIEFNYVADMQMTNVWPISVPDSGTSVVISGINFPSTLRCRVGTVENAVVFSGNNVICTIPKATSVFVELTMNSQNYISYVEISTLKVYTAPVFTSVSQAYGNVGTYIKLTATGLINTNQVVLKLSSVIYFRFITSTTIVFKVPDIVSNSYSLTLSNNGQDFVTMTSLTISDVMQIRSVLPILASIKGGTIFQVKVRNAVNTSFMTCVFHMDYEVSFSLSRSYFVSATYINSTHITCMSPTILYPGTCYLKVSNDNQTFSSTNSTITFIDTCKDRVTCSGNVISACPAGSYCLESFWYGALTCPLGTYMNYTLHTSCFPCPKGQVCTSSVIPSDCPANYTCSQQRLVYPDFTCDPGYYCQVNTSLPSAICAKGYYCDQVDLVCMDGYICKFGAKNYYGESKCPEGFYCIGYTKHVCPPRYYCGGLGNSIPRPCPPGTYNPFVAQVECIECPLGFVCPHSRLLYPVPCPKGYICDEEGLIFPTKLCTPGYYCTEGVATAYLELPCYGITSDDAFDSSFCGYNTMIHSDDPINLSGNITDFNFTQQDLCCWNSSTTSKFVSDISSKKSFQDAASEFFSQGLTGLDLYTPVTSENRALIEISNFFSDLNDQDLFNFFLTQLLNLKKPTICKAGVFCLEGVVNDTVILNSVRSGKTCNPGTFCKEGSNTPAGELCPSGFHCPAGSSDPTPNSPGTSTGFSGNVFEGQCSPNYYSNQNASTFCYNCPNGYECTIAGTIWPEICLQGKYRNYIESSICSECQLSSFSYDFGIISSYECLPCSSGRMCLLAGTYNISLSSKCTQGEYCEEAADISRHEKCPAGFLCDAGTMPSTKYDITCYSGFYCPEGMKYLNKYLYPCPENCYCPPATYDYSVFYANPSEANATSTEYPPTRCPKGTGKVSEGSRSILLMCEMLEIYQTDNPIFEINPIVEEISANFTILSDNNTESYIFHMNSRQVALITFDLMHINDEMLDYGIDWAISFTIQETLDNASFVNPVPMPQSFLRESVVKTGIIEFSILAWTALDFKVSVLIYHGLFHTYSNLFVNTTSVEIFTANRGYYGSSDTYLAVIDNTVALPFNNPNPDISLSFYLLTYSPSPERSNLERVEKINDENWFQPNTKFWGDMSSLFLPYYPYFSNCKGYGQYIPIWLPLELSPECLLVEPAQTEPVIPFAFGTAAVADSCLNVIIECVFDELIADAQANPRWFELPEFTPMFYLTQNTVPDDEFLAQAASAKLISATTMNSVPSGQMPTLVEMQILYQQFDLNLKNVILVIITFLNTSSLTVDQQSGVTQTPYNLSIVYRAMNQKELLINFVFDYTFYFSLFVLVGFITVLFTLMFWIYHKIFCDAEPRPTFKFFNYFILKSRPPCEGFILGFIPVFIAFMANSLLVIGYFLGDFFPVAGKEPYVNNGIFDSILSTYKEFAVVDAPSAQRARLGISLIAMGGYIMWLGAKLFILDDPEEPSEETQGNFWSYVLWKRSNLIFAALIGVAGLQGLTQLSYSAVFGLYSYVFIVVLFVVGTILEYFIIQMVSDELLVEPINQAVGMVTGVATFGASDFVNFLSGYFVGLMNLFVMRLYLDFINDWVIGMLENCFAKAETMIEGITDVNSYRMLFTKIRTMQSIVPDFEDTDNYVEQEEKEIVEYYDSDLESVEEENSYYTFEDVIPTPVVSVQEGDPLDEQEIETLLGHIIGYSGDLLGYLYNPIFTIMCWNYYDYIPFFSAYGIAKPDVFLYVMFGAVMIPFQLATDIILHNANELFNGWALHDFLDFMKQKYANRKKRWIGYDPQNEDIIEGPIKNIYRVCFSPQFFFMSTIFDSGFCFVAIGFVTVLNNPGYNAFDDRATIPITIFSIAMCWVIHKLTIIVANWLKIWEVDESEELPGPPVIEEDNPPNPDSTENPQVSEPNKANLVTPIEYPEESPDNEIIDVIELYNEIYNPPGYDRIVPEIQNWSKVELVKADDEIIKRELDTGKITDPEIQEKFLDVNKEWLQNNLQQIFCDEHFESNRGIMLTKLSKLFGVLQKPAEPRKFPELLPPEAGRIENPSFISIAKYWLKRAQRNRVLYMQAAVVVEENVGEECIYCGTHYMLQAELLQSIEDLFRWFKSMGGEDEKFKMFEWRAEEWREFLRNNAAFRTICLECLEKCEMFNQYSAQIQEMNKERDDDYDEDYDN